MKFFGKISVFAAACLLWTATSVFAQSTPTASINASSTSIQPGENVYFTITGSCDEGLNEIGLELCDSSGTPVTNAGIVGTSETYTAYAFSWSTSTPGTYYFDGYAWNADRSQLTRTNVIAVTVSSTEGGSETPQVTASPSATSAQVGETVSFSVSANCASGLNEMGLEGCDSGGNPAVNLGLVGVSGTSANYTFSWTASVPGTYYFDTYAWNADRSQLTRTAVIVVTVANAASQAPQVTASPSTTSAQVGQTVSFSVSATCASGLNEMGLEGCDSAGNPAVNLGLVGVGGTSASYSFPWTAPSPGTYYFDTYAWNADRSQLTRTAVIVVTVVNPASQAPQVSANPSTTSAQVGQTINFSVSATCASGLNEMGLEGCDSAGNPAVNLGLVGVGGTSASYSFPWTAPSPGTYYFDTYAWNADRSQLTRTAVIVVTVANPASQPPQVSAFPSTTFVQAGQAVNFSVSASCVSGLNEMGLESCDSAGNPTGTLALIGASGTFASNTFSWTAPSPGTYYFDAYAWNADRSLRTRTPLMVVTVTAAAAPLQVTSTTSGTSIGVGQQVTFNLSASSGTGLREIGLEQCNAAGATIARIDSASAVGNNWSRAFAWISTGPGTYYFKGYAIDSAGSQTAYTALTTVTVAAPVPVDRTLPATSTAAISYNAARLALFSGGQTVKVDSVTGYILQGRLATGSDQYLYYGPDRFTAFLQNSIIKFADGYVSDGYMDNSGDSVILSYGPDRVAQFYAKSHALFEDGYVSNGYLNYQGTSVSLPYGPGRVTNFYPQSHIKFRDGYVADGFMNNSGSAVTLSYGAGRTTAFLPKAHIKFSGGFVADGYLNGSGSNVLLNFGSTGVASFLPSCHVTFADGYVATGSLSTDGYNTFFRYNPDGSQVTINTQATNIVDGTVDKKKVNDVLKRIHKDWAAIFDFSRFVSTILSDGTIALLDALADGRLIAKLSAADVALQELPIIFADEIPNIPNNYIIHIQYPSVAFAPGADGRGYLVLGQLLQGTLLRTKTGLVSVPAGKTCVFVDGFYVP